MLQGGSIDPAVNTLAGYQITDNVGPSPTVSISGTIDVNTPGDYNIVVTAQDSQNNTATYTRVLTVMEPFYQHPSAITGETVLTGAMPGTSSSDVTITFLLHGTCVTGCLLNIGNHSMGNQSLSGFRLYWLGGTLWNVGVVSWPAMFNTTLPMSSAGIRWVLSYSQNVKEVRLWVGDMVSAKVSAGNYVFQHWGDKELAIFQLLNSPSGSPAFYHEKLATVNGCSVQSLRIYPRVLTQAERQAL